MATTNDKSTIAQQAAIQSLVEKARAEDEENRYHQRFPFFQPVSISAEKNGTISLSAFSRDISEVGIGLLLYFPVKLRFVHLKIHFGEGEDVSITGYVRWCHPCGQGWYAAGVTFNNEESDDISFASGIHL